MFLVYGQHRAPIYRQHLLQATRDSSCWEGNDLHDTAFAAIYLGSPGSVTVVRKQIMGYWKDISPSICVMFGPTLFIKRGLSSFPRNMGPGT